MSDVGTYSSPPHESLPELTILVPQDMMDDEDYDFDYEDSDQDQDDGQVDMENEYYTAKGGKSPLSTSTHVGTLGSKDVS